MTETANQRYRVVEKLESGGMAEVFRAESEGLQGFRKQVAIKRVLPQLSSKTKFIRMFLDEARLSAHLSHSNCVQVFDIGVGDNAYFIVMEFVDGANLKHVIDHRKKRGKDFPVEQAVFIMLEICKGLSYAHELTAPDGQSLALVHRDISPPNVLITKYGEVKIVDFGLARATSQLERSEPGIIKGKFSYLSPEAALGQEIDHRTDIFAVGIMLWELLAGQRLFLGDTDYQTVKRVQASVVPSIRQLNPKVPPELEKIIVRTLARSASERYQTARELGMDLNNFLFTHGTPVSTFDIAKLVQGAMREKQRSRPRQASLIDKLIEEALFEFTSLKDERGNFGANPISVEGGRLQSIPPEDAPIAPESYVNVGAWVDEISKQGADQLRMSLPNVSEGNLSLLEEDHPAVPHQGGNPLSDIPPLTPRPGPSTGASDDPRDVVTLRPASRQDAPRNHLAPVVGIVTAVVLLLAVLGFALTR